MNLNELLIVISVLVSLWSVYNSSLALIGLSWRPSERKSHTGPSFSLLIPARNEGKVLGRLLERLVNQEYDRSKYEVIVVEDGSTDDTLQVCQNFSKMYTTVKCIHLEPASVPNGKSRALNYALSEAKGDIIGVFDADSVPRLDTLAYVAGKFDANPRIGAVQGRLVPINVRESIIARLASLEELFNEYLISGRAKLGFFVPLEGTCSFVRRDVILSLGGWNERSLTEDLDLSLKIASMDYLIAYSPSVISWREVPVSFWGLVKQRLRWYRGHIELAFPIGRMKISWRLIDAGLLIATPIFMALSVANYSLVFLYPSQLHLVVAALVSLASILSFFLSLLISKRHMIETVYVILTAGYINLTIFLNVLSIFMELVGMPKTWVKTERSGKVTIELGKGG
ncbi:MAG: glycosyltransferase [Metallosphaera yellowstonensis]|jgi:Glycosyltransferases, probably involved in cell wall biogenesis